MALFDRVDSGFPELDEALDYCRIGDNVVCRLSELGVPWEGQVPRPHGAGAHLHLEDQDCHIYYDFLPEKLLGLIHEP